MPIVVQSLFPGLTGQLIVPHAPAVGLQATSHLHELAHEIAPHAPLPVQLTVHAPSPHVMSPHGAVSVHVMTQLQPAGQVVDDPVPVRLHVPVGKSHEAHALGQTGASSCVAASSVTQYPA